MAYPLKRKTGLCGGAPGCAETRTRRSGTNIASHIAKLVAAQIVAGFGSVRDDAGNKVLARVRRGPQDDTIDVVPERATSK